MADSIHNDKQGKLEADTDVVACWPGGGILHRLDQTFESLVYGVIFGQIKSLLGLKPNHLF